MNEHQEVKYMALRDLGYEYDFTREQDGTVFMVLWEHVNDSRIRRATVAIPAEGPSYRLPR